MEELSDVISEATSRIEGKYINFPLDGGMPIYRERVYCYELYHHMRSVWPEGCEFTLNGEVDKRAHPILKNMDISQSPDLLIHKPGLMAGNHCVVEVKPAQSQSSGIVKDLETLSKFVKSAGYGRAILFIYGHAERSQIDRVQLLYDSLERPAEIELWLHERAGSSARQVDLLLPNDPRVRARQTRAGQ